MMRNSLLRCMLFTGIVLTYSQIYSVSAAPLARHLHDEEWEYYYDCSSTTEIVRTVLESSNGQAYVPITFTTSYPYTTKDTTAYSITIITSSTVSGIVSETYIPISSAGEPSSSGFTSASPSQTVFSTEQPDTSFYTPTSSAGEPMFTSASSSQPILTSSPTLSETSSLTSLTSLSSSAVQTAGTTLEIQTSGTVVTSLQTSGETSAVPFPTSVASASTTLSLIDTATTSLAHPNITSTATALSVSNLFVALDTAAPPSQITQRPDHPAPTLGIAPQSSKLETNKFYANFFLGGQTSPSFTHPYSVAWVKGSGGSTSYGVSVSHIERSQLVFGPGDPARCFVNPVGIKSLILSASELKNSTSLTTDSLDAFSVNVNLLQSAGEAPLITFPLVQGMAFVTGVYSNSTPRIETTISFSNVTYLGLVSSGSTYKYQASLADGTTWLIYVTTSQVGYPCNAFTLRNARLLQGAPGFKGFIQVAKLPLDSGTEAESVFDDAAGAYPVSTTISGSVTGVSGTYTLEWAKQGVANRTLLMFALPHHIETLDSSGAKISDIKLVTTTKGYATAVIGDSWTLTEPDLPVEIGFAPWSPSVGSVDSVSEEAAQLIEKAGENELSQDMDAQSNLNSMYYSGKALAKFGAIVYAVHDIAGNATLAISGLEKLKTAFAVFVDNRQVYPLIYDSKWGGVVSSGTYQTGDSGLDFGNTFYNDHHFHYGYFVYAAAVIGYMDPSWLDEGDNKAWVNMLVRDYANGVKDDSYFPLSRSFDWYHGHSWAKGLFDSLDGKDQESTSEDSMSSYALKMWGRTINDTALEARGTLMMAMQARSFQHYFLYESDNEVQPSKFIGNKVSGILFENKIDHTTYFGSNPEWIHGIHMIPLMPFSTYTRTRRFVTEEWDAFFSNGRADVDGGWRGILYANLASIDSVSSYGFFSDLEFNTEYLDGGASLTWYLAYSAALGGSPATYASKRSEAEGTRSDERVQAQRVHRAAHRRMRHGH